MRSPWWLRSLNDITGTVVGPVCTDLSGVALNLDATDRRRLVVAAALTLIALPAIWLFARGEPGNGTAAPNVAGAAGVAVPGNGVSSSQTEGTVDPFGTDNPIFVDGPSTPPKAVVVPVVVPASTEADHIDGLATYKHNDDPATTTCSATNAPFNQTLTVTNLDNGRSWTCVNKTPAVFGKGIEIQLTTEQFEKIGQLVDAPLHVRISWGAP